LLQQPNDLILGGAERRHRRTTTKTVLVPTLQDAVLRTALRVRVVLLEWKEVYAGGATT